jgi:hypothetical protein
MKTKKRSYENKENEYLEEKGISMGYASIFYFLGLPALDLWLGNI